MPLKPEVRSNWPPGGWMWYEPQTGWEAPNPLANTFDQQVNAIIAHRRANPRFGLATDFDEVAAQLDAYTCARIQNHPKFCDGGPPKKAPRLSPTPHPLVKKAVVAVAGVDPSVLFSWLGDGGEPVSKEKANARAGVCAGWDKGSKCPGNVSKGWRDLLTAPAAEWIRLTLEAKHQMDLSTDYDDQLGVCKFCRCHLGLKAFVPIQHIRDNTDPEDLQKLDQRCWVLSELQ